MTAMTEVHIKTDDVMRHQFGELGTQIRRIKEKTDRASVARWLEKQGKNCPPEIQLRAYLAIGRTPEPGLVSGPILRRALSTDDCASFANLLTAKRVLLDSSAVMSTLGALVSNDRKIRVQRVAGTLARIVEKWHDRRNRIPLDAGSVRAYIDVLLALLEKTKNESSSRSHSKRDALFLRLVVIAILQAAEATNPTIQAHALRLIEAAQGVIDPELSNALDQEQNLQSAYDSIISRAIEQLRKMAVSGKSEELEKSALSLLRSKVTKRQAEESLRSLYSDRGQLETTVQRVLARLLGIGEEMQAEPDFETGLAPSVRSTQLASALVRSWAAAGESRRAREAFDELQSVVRNFFGIQLRSEPGEVAEFNPAVHELAQISGERPVQVRIIRPRVEMSNGPVTNVLIKALVEPAWLSQHEEEDQI